MSFNKFEKLFNEKMNIYDFMDVTDVKNNGGIPDFPFEWVLIENKDHIRHDSYGNENSTLQRIIFVKGFDIYVKFWGTRSSYVGEEWHGYKEATKTVKTITTWN